MCLARSAHGVVPNHPVLNGPFKTELDFATAPTPENYRRYYDGRDLPGELRVVHIDTTDYRTEEGMNPGTVATGWGFDDSPDAEIIASGINSKGPNAVALGRQGSLFHWGFACEPARMTDTGRALFLNAIDYIADFDHAPLLVRDVARDRRWSLQRALEDPEALARLEADVEYLTADGTVDEDCKALGLSNRRVELLERCVGELGRGEGAKRARRVLERYTGESFASAEEWRAWLDEARPHLFFSDRGGFRFFRVDAAAPALDIDAPEIDEGRVALALGSLHGETVAPGATFTLEVQVHHADGWHTYAHVPDDLPYRESALTLDLPAGVTTVGRWERPRGHPLDGEPGVRVFEGVATFRRVLRIGADVEAGELEIGLAYAYMACDANGCLPPSELSASVAVEVLSR